MVDEAEQIRVFLDELIADDVLVIVEGLKDIRALKALGVSNIIQLKQPLYAVVEEVAAKAKEVAILTDLDDKGRELYHTLSVGLQRHGVKINNRLREFLFKTKLSHVEGLSTYLEPKG